MEDEEIIDYDAECNNYRKLLLNLFNAEGMNTFNYACALIRVGGTEDAGWDPLRESRELVNDIINIIHLDCLDEHLSDPDKMRFRLMLLAYSHLTEMDAPYELLANLLRVKAGLHYVINPFLEVQQKKMGKKKKRTFLSHCPPPSPYNKIKHIKELAEKASLENIGNAFDEFYIPDLRHSISHSDYIIHNNEFRMLHGYVNDENMPNVLTNILSLHRIEAIIQKTFAFYSELFALERWARSCFISWKGKCFPFDKKLKGLIEFILNDGNILCGFKIHWPNLTDSYYLRTESACRAVNIEFDREGHIGFHVGEYFKQHNPGSPLVPIGKTFCYTLTEGETTPPSWPLDS